MEWDLILHYLPEFAQFPVSWTSDANHHILCCHLLLLPSVFPSIRVFSSELALCIKWPKYWNFSFSISPSNEYSGLISFRIDWFDLLAWESKGLSRVFSITTFWKHQFFGAQPMVQLSHPYMTTGKTIALTMWTFIGKVMSLLLSTLFRFLVAFLPRSRHLLLSWLQSLSTMILEPKKIKSVTTSNTLATWCKELTHWKTRWC